jgi:hypothetical protein
MDSSSYTSTYAYANLTVKTNDKDALSDKAIGTTYTIPVTVQIVGRDGISKDSTVKIKVKVKK